MNRFKHYIEVVGRNKNMMIRGDNLFSTQHRYAVRGSFVLLRLPGKTSNTSFCRFEAFNVLIAKVQMNPEMPRLGLSSNGLTQGFSRVGVAAGHQSLPQKCEKGTGMIYVGKR